MISKMDNKKVLKFRSICISKAFKMIEGPLEERKINAHNVPTYDFLHIRLFRIIRGYPIISDAFSVRSYKKRRGKNRKSTTEFLAIVFSDLPRDHPGECKTTILDFLFSRERTEFGTRTTASASCSLPAFSSHLISRWIARRLLFFAELSGCIILELVRARIH